MPTTSLSTTLLESVNIVLANLGESPVNSLSGGALPQQVSLALNTIEEVSTDIQSKGWWFNQQTGSSYDTTANIVIYPSNTTNEWGSDIPEEARRYITIRASRIAQTRLIGSEELQKFSYNEELVSLAILQQAHVRNSNGVLDFNSFPVELRGLGMDEVMFLQGNVEEKIGTLRLGGELANIAKTKAETELLADQEALVEQQLSTEVEETAKRTAEKDLLLAQELKVDAETELLADQEALTEQQVLTEVQETTKRTREAELIEAQEALLQKQILTEAEQVAKIQEEVDLLQTQDTLVAAQATDVAADTSLKGVQEDLLETQIIDVAADTALKTSQKTQLDAQTAIEATAEKNFYDGVVAGTQDTYRDFAAEMRIMGVQESTFQQTPAYKKIELLKDAAKLRLVTATETGTDATELLEVNKVMRFIGESPVTALNSNSLASECARLLRDTDTELQGRGWYFNIEEDVELTPSLVNNTILIPSNMLSLEINTYNTRIITIVSSRFLYDLSEKSYQTWISPVKGKAIYKRSLSDTPQKYREYLSVRVAILLTELYPQSGVDIQRLPKMEAELRAYFKDREFDDANYSIFDSYDVATRIGINRNYDLI
jgi:hypothetical protein